MIDRLGNEVNAGDFIAIANSTGTSNAELVIARATLVTGSRVYYEVITGRLHGSYITSSSKFIVLFGVVYADPINKLIMSKQNIH